MPAIENTQTSKITENTALTDICPYCSLDYCNCDCVACAHCGIVTEIFCPDCYDFCPQCCICGETDNERELIEDKNLASQLLLSN